MPTKNSPTDANQPFIVSQLDTIIAVRATTAAIMAVIIITTGFIARIPIIADVIPNTVFNTTIAAATIPIIVAMVFIVSICLTIN